MVEGLARVRQDFRDEAEKQCLAGIEQLIATERPPRENAPACNWVVLNLHYESACRSWVEEAAHLPPRRRNKLLAVADRARAAEGWAHKLYAEFNRWRERCACGGKETPPANLATLVKTRGWGDRDMIEYLLSDYHQLTQSSVHRLLDYGTRRIKALRKEGQRPRSGKQGDRRR
jgi:hypothetical protein